MGEELAKDKGTDGWEKANKVDGPSPCAKRQGHACMTAPNLRSLQPLRVTTYIMAEANNADKKTIDPFDIEALEKSLNDSATRVSTIWISFLIFSLYLLVTAATVDHRQLLLAEPVKLPVLNIDLPLLGFFFLIPYLFVIFHVYVLLQVLLLGRTAIAYNEALDKAAIDPTANSAIRQRLANTLFAQIFAGSPRERDGWLGRLLRCIAWVTLAITPIFILSVFQLTFLPYHSHLATWSHRFLILAEIATTFLIWPLALDAKQDSALHGLRRHALLMASCALFAFLCLSVATFPGEPHVNLFSGQSLSTVQCDRWVLNKFDRLYLPDVDVVDDEKLARIMQATSDRKLRAYEGERTRSFRDRNLNCGNFSSADLRRVDLTDASLSGAILDFANLEGTSLFGAQLENASLDHAYFGGANFDSAKLQGASFDNAHLQGASLPRAKLQGASFRKAELQGADFFSANLQGASLISAQLQGAVLLYAELQGASLVGARLQGANILSAQLQGASFFGAQLQGSNLSDSQIDLADLSEAYVWRTKIRTCSNARVSNLKFAATIESDLSGEDKKVQTTLEGIEKFIGRSTANIPDPRARDEARERMRLYLLVDKDEDDAAKTMELWSNCQNSAKIARGKLEKELVQFLRGLVCNAQSHGDTMVKGIIAGRDVSLWGQEISDRTSEIEKLDRGNFFALFAQAMLGEAGRNCKIAEDLDQQTRGLLRKAIAGLPTRQF